MKFIHCADIHLGSKMEAKLPKAKALERRDEVRQTFLRMVEYAKKEGVCAILLSGDVFDSDRPLKTDKEFFYNVVKGNPEIDFLYLRGNHDGEETYVENLLNLKTFSEEWTGYEYGGVSVFGLEISRGNHTSMYSSLRLNKDRKNIVMLHGDEGGSKEAYKINFGKLAEKHIDYLALGHIHSFREERLDDRGRYAFSGCLEGRGFDDTGEKGFVLLEVEETVESRFIPWAKRTIEEVFVDISEAEGVYDACETVKAQVKFNRENLYRIELIGEIDFDNETLANSVENYLKDECYFVSVKDKTLRKINPEKYEGEVSLRGEFVRMVWANGELSDEEKRQVITLGLKALEGREVD